MSYDHHDHVLAWTAWAADGMRRREAAERQADANQRRRALVAALTATLLQGQRQFPDLLANRYDAADLAEQVADLITSRRR